MTGNLDGRVLRSIKRAPKKDVAKQKIFWEKEEPPVKSRNNRKIVSDKKGERRRGGEGSQVLSTGGRVLPLKIQKAINKVYCFLNNI